MGVGVVTGNAWVVGPTTPRGNPDHGQRCNQEVPSEGISPLVSQRRLRGDRLAPILGVSALLTNGASH